MGTSCRAEKTRKTIDSNSESLSFGSFCMNLTMMVTLKREKNNNSELKEHVIHLHKMSNIIFYVCLICKL